MNGYPIISLTSFAKSASNLTTNATITPIITQTTNITLPIAANAVHNGEQWSNVTFTFELLGANATQTIIWIPGACNAANKTWSTSTLQTYTGINSSCLTPGSTLALYFANTSTDGSFHQNITRVNVTYLKYVTSGAYTLVTTTGVITPTTDGHYEVSYTYSAGGIDYTNSQTALGQGITTISNIPSWLVLIVLVFVLLVVLSLIAAVVYVARSMGGGNQ